MRILTVLIMVLFGFGVLVSGGCATLTQGDVLGNDAPTGNVVVKQAESDHWWDIVKMTAGTVLSVIGSAVLFNNF